MLSEKQLKLIEKWANDPEELNNSLKKEEASIYKEISRRILNLIEEFESSSKIFPTGKEDFYGLEDLYTQIQLQFEGGEDLMSD